VKLYCVNDLDWEEVKAYVFVNADPWPSYRAWPGEAMTKTEEKANEKDIYSYEFPETYTTIIFNNGTEQSENLAVDATKPYYSLLHKQWYATAADVPAGEPVYVLEDGYYLIGSAQEWKVEKLTAALKFAETATEGELLLKTTLVLDQEIKVVAVEKDAIKTWYPDGMGNAFKVTDKFTGEHDIYFRPAGNTDWEAFHAGGFFWMGANPSTAIDNTADGVKAVKVLENGQLLIIKGNKTYNVLGTIVK